MNFKEIPYLVAFTGPEGAGKSTQARLLAQTCGLPYISTGELIRDCAENNQAELGDACRKMFSENAYLAPQLVLQILAKRLEQGDVRDGVILDGGFRTSYETQNFEKMLEKNKIPLRILLIYLRIAGWQSFERLSERSRPDDTQKGILSRLNYFYKGLGGRMSFAKKRWPFIMVNSSKPIEEVSEDILAKLKERRYELIKERISYVASGARSLPEVEQKLLAFLHTVSREELTGRIGYIAGIITSDGPEHIATNVARLAAYTEQVRATANFPVFSSTDIFSDNLFAQLEEMKLPSEEREKQFVQFWRKVLGCGHITDIFMTPRWEESKGARDEHATAKQKEILIHYL